MVPTVRKPWYRRRWVLVLLAVPVVFLVVLGVLGFSLYRVAVNSAQPQPVWEGPLTPEQRREIFDALWTTVQRNYSYLELKGIDWRARRATYWPEAKAAPDDAAFYRVLERMVASLDDGHSRLVSYPGQQPVTTPPLTLGWVEEQYVVLEVDEALADRVTPGDRLTAIDGRPVAEVAAELRPYIGEATEARRQRRIARSLLTGPPGSAVAATFLRPDGGEYTVVLERPEPEPDSPTVGPQPTQVTAREIEGFGYIRIHMWTGDAAYAFDAALERFRGAPGLILDVRGNGGGDDRLASQVAGRLFAERQLFSRFRFRMYPFWTPLMPHYVEPRGPWTYTGPVVLLIDEGVYSSNDFFVGGLARTGRVTTVGRPTGAGSANPEIFTLPGGARVRLSRWIEYFPDGTPVEGNGTRPDIEVQLTIADIAAGRDPDVEAALAVLRGQR
ncbi:S41 family peptidase [Symbiobacterium terraclitae]|uniref:S41 family peptidase n=1 Tax=Symbiobacterium terraclitae TaxID=557451 RepID=UPI0035B5342D